VQVPEVRELREFEEFSGRLDAVGNVQIRARVTGFLEEVAFKEGAEVAKGDLLFKIDPREYRAANDSAQAALQQAQARLTQARSDTDRAQKLRTQTAISVQELERQATTLHEAEGAVRAAEAGAARSQLNLDFTEIRAPIDGKISRTRVTVGNLVEVGNTLTTLVTQDPIYVYFDAPEQSLERWRALDASGQGPAGAISEVRVALPSEDGFPHPASLDFADNEIAAGTGTLRLRAVLPNGKRLFQPGGFVRVRVLSGKPQNTLLVPDRAIASDQGERFVYVVDAAGKAVYRRVKIGQLYGHQRAILSGLAPADRVVIDGIQNVRAGMPVKVDTPPPGDDEAPKP